MSCGCHSGTSIPLVKASQIIIEIKKTPEVSLRLFDIAELCEQPELPDSNGLTSPATALFTKLTVIALIAQKANTGI